MKWYKLELFLVCFLILAAKPAYACSCFHEGGFLEMATKADLIVEAKVLEHGKIDEGPDVYFDVELLREFSSAGIENRRLKKEVLRVWGDNGFQCRRSVGEFRDGSIWVFALKKLKEKGASSKDYLLSVCGEFALKREGEYLLGVIRGMGQSPKESISLKEFDIEIVETLSKK